MWLLAGVVLTLGWVIGKEIPRMWMEESYKELSILSVITLLVTLVSTAQSLYVHMPNPLNWIEAVLGPYPRMVYALLQ
ncbi:hypothetical protein [Paenibacillus sp. N3.4]|uniref:hypothetical protein n=1 Tax=Paenibacillus sp. N3.4 TaxID=2603222 RepID=UPI0011CBF4DF|nr:hypothetical protein [Paenibacillus sp. N3.4]TXK71919.1 hypothetical protein FU659_32090 [Paenibacillus sp. N3.4]